MFVKIVKCLYKISVSLTLSLTYFRTANCISCTQSCIEGSNPPASLYYFYPKVNITPFYQWESNNGYCGEVSLIQSGLANGQWTSQYNIRSIASPFPINYSQTGKSRGINYYSQLLLFQTNVNSKKYNSFENAAKNYLLQGSRFESTRQVAGKEGLKNFLLWIKQNVLNGNIVTIGVSYSDEPEYDHIVTVTKIGSNFPRNDTTYHGNDVLYFDDHGAIPCNSDTYPAIPPGVGTSSSKSCTPYIYGYTFDNIANQVNNSKMYKLAVPTLTNKNFGHVIYIAKDIVPVNLEIVDNSSPKDPIAKFNYENPFIGTSNYGGSVTNKAPNPFPITLQPTVTGLTIGNTYNLYMYEFSLRPLPSASLNISNAITKIYTFTATNLTYIGEKYLTTSDKTVIYRAGLRPRAT